jgi:tRNA U34 2-thiouridine synthase MnmA/TrmU
VSVTGEHRPVTVAFSGGKDSTAAALFLREQGRDVRALTMRLGTPGEEERLGRIEDLARALDVPWRIIDLRDAFQEKVLESTPTAAVSPPIPVCSATGASSSACFWRRR